MLGWDPLRTFTFKYLDTFSWNLPFLNARTYIKNALMQSHSAQHLKIPALDRQMWQWEFSLIVTDKFAITMN